MTCTTNAPTSEPTASSNALSFIAAMALLLNEEPQNHALEMEKVQFEDIEISLSPFALVNLWAMALLALCVNTLLMVRCILKLNKYPEEHDFASSNEEEEEEEDVDF